MTEEQDIFPLPGRAFVGMRPQYADFYGDIIIPKTAIRAKGRIGKVCSVTLYPVGKNSWVFKSGEIHSVPAYKDNDQYSSLINQWVVCRNATLLWGMLYEVRLEHIMSMVPEEATPQEDDVGRCKRCRSQGEANILLGQDGFCPVCGYNEMDKHISEDCIIAQSPWGEMQLNVDRLGERDIDDLVRKPAELDHFMKTGGKAISNSIISFPGQKNRGGLNVAGDDELNDVMKRRKT